MIDIERNIAGVKGRIQQAISKSLRDDLNVNLLAVSKNQPASAIITAHASGLSDFGENYVQEAEAKIRELSTYSIKWHFIGEIQSNKTRFIAEHFDWVHSVDRLKIAQRLNDQRPIDLPPLNICLQINIDNEASKAGIREESLADLITAIQSMPNLCLRGLMAIPAPIATAAKRSSNSFARMRVLFDQHQQQLGAEEFDTLSMGMSADLELAVAEGATLLRVGSDIFGPRK